MIGISLDDVAKALAISGLIPRGGFSFEAGEDAPAGPTGRPARAVMLVGHAGPAVWEHFARWRRGQPEDLDNPLDRWSRQVIGEVAGRFGARAAFPFERPWLPFQQWAMRAEKLKPSPLGILMHPEYGLWHAYRGALLFADDPMAGRWNGPVEPPLHPCDFCITRPCLKTCPVEAHSTAGFDRASCLAHVRSAAGEPCRRKGCLDRNACPNGTAYRYLPAQQAFHMAAFAQ